MISIRTNPCYIRLVRLGNRKNACQFISLSTQFDHIVSAAKNVNIPCDWKPEPAHLKSYTPSISMIIWALEGNRAEKMQKYSNEILSDKKFLIKNLSKLQETGNVSFSNDIALIAEGCDTGNYLPLLFAALTRDGRERVIRPFLINGSHAMVNKACKVAYTLLSTQKDNVVYGDVCNAFDRYPSELDKFESSQKIFTPFRMGVVGSYEEIRTYLKIRMPIMNKSGLCCFSVLLDTKNNRNTLNEEYRGLSISREGNGYAQLFKLIRPETLKMISKMYPKKSGEILSSLKDNPIFKSFQTYPCLTIFQETALDQLIREVGGQILGETQYQSIHSQMDSGRAIDICPIIIASKEYDLKSSFFISPKHHVR